MHLQAGVANGTLVEIHYLANELSQRIFTGLPAPKDGFIDMPETPGLGFAVNRDAVKEYAQ
jgi:L-alanine-DL-glutamate epimerase-like enolase superfamily enzyme